MDNQYEHDEKSMKSKVEALILENYKGETIKKERIVDQVKLEYSDRYGEDDTSRVRGIVQDALNGLREKKLASNEETGHGEWKIYGEALTNEWDGIGCVYFYYFPAYKELAEHKGEDRWPFKIGSTKNVNPDPRVEEQVTAMAEQPKIEVVMRTENPKALEQLIHSILKKKQDIYIEDAPGKEWYRISPDIAKKIKEAFEDFKKNLDFESLTQ